MGIMTRFARLFKADIHGVIDQIENKELILKQCLREMETSLTKKKGKLNRLNATLEQYKTKNQQIERERVKSEKDLVIALEKEKDDIARHLIKKRMQIDQRMAASRRQTDSIIRQIEILSENIETQKHQYAEMTLRSESWLQNVRQQTWEDASPEMIIPECPWHSISDEAIELELIKQKESLKGGI